MALAAVSSRSSRHGDLFRPVSDIGAKDQLCIWVGLAHTVVDAAAVGGVIVFVRLVGRIRGHVGQLRGSGQRTAVEDSGGDGTGIHQRHIAQLAV